MDIGLLKVPAGAAPDPAEQLSSALQTWAAARIELSRLRAIPPHHPAARAATADAGRDSQALQATIRSQQQLCARLRLDFVRCSQEASARQDSPPAGAAAREPGSLVNVLLVDDEPRNLLALEAVLEQPGYRLVRAASGEEALAALATQEFACLLVDVRMPGMTGFELARRINAQPRATRAPIIFLTAHDPADELALEGYASGAVDYLHKPFQPAALRQKVEVFADLHRACRQLQVKPEDGAAPAGATAADRDGASFLAQADCVLGQTLDFDDALAAVLELAVPLLGDGAALALADATGQLRWLAVEPGPGVDDAGVAGAELRAEAERAMRSGKARFSHDGSRAALACPLHVCGRAIGVLRIHAPAAAFDPARRDLVAEFCRRAALVLEGARLHAAMQEADRAKERLVVMLSHELRNPLAPIATAAQIISRQAVPDSATARASAVIERQVAQLARLTSDLVDGASSVDGKLSLDIRTHALASIVQLAVASIAPLAHRRQQSIAVEAPDTDLVVQADAVRLAQALANLVDNASKFSGPRGEIRVTLADLGGEVQVSVKDSGSGIEPGFLPHVFDLFAQGEQPVDRAQGGLGIGLALARHVVELHGGRVEACSPGPGQGTEMRVRLPAVPTTQA